MDTSCPYSPFPGPHYGGRVPVRSCNISGAQNLSGFPRFLPGHWALGLQKLPPVRFHNCAWVFSAIAPGANPGGPVWDRPLRRRETVFVIRRRGGSQTRPLKPSPFQGEGGWPLGQTDEGDFLARTPPAGAPRGSPTQIKDRFWKPVGEGLAPPAVPLSCT